MRRLLSLLVALWCGPALATDHPLLVRPARVFDGTAMHEFDAPRIDTPHTHGTGCTLSAAMAVFLARGHDLPAAVDAAKTYLTEAQEGVVPRTWWPASEVGSTEGSGRKATTPMAARSGCG